MGRELKRVAMDFKWPLNQVWKGYLNPYHSQPCKPCNQSGLNPETKRLNDDWYSFDRTEWVWINSSKRYNNAAWQYHLTQDEVDALVDWNRLYEFTHTFVAGDGWKRKEPPYRPTADEVNRWSLTGFGHDSINRSICVEVRAKHLGVYGLCEFCNGEGNIWQSEEIRKLSEEWQSFEPPLGDGFQLWETTNEGSPISPAFASLDELCEWAAGNANTFGSFTATAQEWREMLDADFVHHKEGNAVFI
jgi:hypothetical protein